MDSPNPREEKHVAWNRGLEEILKKEAEQSEGLFWLHNRSWTITARKNDMLMLPSIIISAINGFLIGAADTQIPPLALGLVSIAVGVLSTITTYFKYAQKAEGHRIASLLYLKMYKTIEIELAKPTGQRGDAEDILKSLRDQMSRVAETAPQIEERAILEFKGKFKEGKVSHPIIANGLTEVRINTEASNRLDVDN